MRLTEKEHQTIKSVITHHIPNAEIYLFGSRVDDTKRGGDIDILIIDEGKKSYSTKLSIMGKLHEILGEQKIDLLIQEKNNLTPFGELARMDAVPL